VRGLGIAIYTDEMVYSRFAAALRARGYDAIGCAETTPTNRGISDYDQLAYAAADSRAILTENVGDFSLLDAQWKMSGKVHAGIIVYAGIDSFGELLRRVVIHLDTIAKETQRDTLLWLA
jgi:hypothetical protein